MFSFFTSKCLRFPLTMFPPASIVVDVVENLASRLLDEVNRIWITEIFHLYMNFLMIGDIVMREVFMN